LENNQYKFLSVIIPSYNSEQLFPQFLPSVYKAAENYQGKWEVIIVDDCSTDTSVSVTKTMVGDRKDTTLLINERNLGFPGTCNVGIRQAQGEILFFLNSDVELTSDFFQHFSQHFDDPRTFAVTINGRLFGTERQIDGIKTIAWVRGLPRVTENIMDDKIAENSWKQPFQSFGVQGAYFFADANKVRELGGFDEIYSPFLFEETDLAYRAMKHGWDIYFDQSSVAYHKLSASINAASVSMERKILATRNRIIFTWINIHSTRLIMSHLLFLLLRQLTLSIVYWRGTLRALKLLPIIRQRRRKEKSVSVVSDRAILEANRTRYCQR
jgi:GT2 family glycosyltransferase